MKRKIIFHPPPFLGFMLPELSCTDSTGTAPQKTRHMKGRVMIVGGDGIESGSLVAILQRLVLPGSHAFGARFNDSL